MPLRAKTWLILALIFSSALIVFCFWDKVPSRLHPYYISRAKAELVGFVVGFKQFQAEYNDAPMEALSDAREEVPQQARGALLQVLRGKEPKVNPRNISFWDPPLAKDKKAGLCQDEHGVPVFIDPWGTPYQVVIDLNGDGKVPNPDPRDKKEHPFIESPIILFSAGPDRDINTWEDNVLSWK